MVRAGEMSLHEGKKEKRIVAYDLNLRRNPQQTHATYVREITCTGMDCTSH